MDQMNDKLREILTQIQEGTPRAYEALTSEIYMMGWKYTITTTIAVIVVVAMLIYAHKNWRRGNEEGWSDLAVSRIVVPLFVLFMATIMFFMSGSYALDHFLSPNLVLIERLVK